MIPAHIRRNVSIIRLLTAAIALVMVSSCSDDTAETRNDPLKVLEEFYAYDGAEDTLMDPLIVAGKSVVPVLVESVVTADMPKRRYAIQALGNIGDSRAIPALEKLSKTESEPGYIRCVSTQAVAQINWDTGQVLAASFVEPQEQAEEVPECLARVSRQILEYSREDWLERTGIVRSLEDAKKRRHY